MKRFSIIIIFLMILTGCANNAIEDKVTSVKILAWNEKLFNEKYGNFFRATHTNYEIEVISIIEHLTDSEDFNITIKRLIESEAPDVVVLNMNDYEIMKEQGLLSALTPYIKQDKFKTEDITPAVLNFLTDEQGQMYGLTPTFVGSALFYNVKLLQERGIPVPTDAMTWDEVFQHVQLFPNEANAETPVYGYYDKYISNPFLMALYIGEGNGLAFYNQERFVLQSKSWEKVFQYVTDCWRLGACYEKKETGTSPASGLAAAQLASYPFLEGNIAIAVHDLSLYHLLTSGDNNFPDLEWGMVSIPTGSEQPGLGSGITMNDIFSLTKAGNQKAGWELINYVCGPDYARLLPTVNPEELPARAPSELQDDRLAAFYELNRISNKTIRTLRSLPREVITKMDEISPAYMSDMISEKVTVAETLGRMELELQSLLNENK